MLARNAVLQVEKRSFNFCFAIVFAAIFCLLFSANASGQIKKFKETMRISPFSNPPARTKAKIARSKLEQMQSQRSDDKRVMTPSPEINLNLAGKTDSSNAELNDWEREPLFRQFADFILNLKNNGFRRTQDFVVRAVDDDMFWKTFYKLNKDKNYVIFAVCDGACPILNLHLYDEVNDLMAFHKDRKSKPVIYFTPRKTGNYIVKTTVVACRKEPCKSAVSVYER